MSKCNFMQRARSLAEREMGCPLDHCPNGHHIGMGPDFPDMSGDVEDDGRNRIYPCLECFEDGICGGCGVKHLDDNEMCHEAVIRYNEAAAMTAEIEEAEIAAGWDPSP
mgnify:CR=1 FL=1